MELEEIKKARCRAYKQKWRDENREHVRRYHRWWQRRNPEKVREYKRRHRLKMKELKHWSYGVEA